MALDFPMPNIRELLPPPIFFMRLREMICPTAMKITSGSTQPRMLISSEVCWISSPVVEIPASSRRCTSPSSGTMAVL